ncbi:sulfur carrier protein [Dyadobacter jejuensis]|uniref:Sulfur carrier protein n=1 Tax=Dyadobacter jejuensis TaxID=1082580 RepID=A0A316ALT3_9BACT|nr:sulfur carrier protein ThiS [Dyadobacter jejuensis]PWJ58713.1 sulfur carrier protein [Dyadobacter jejuensis]
MEILLNNLPKQIPEDCTVSAVLDLFLPKAPTGLAVAVNQSVIPKSAWESHRLKASDRLTIITATQGG